MIEKLTFVVMVPAALEVGFPVELGRVEGPFCLVTVSPGDPTFELLRSLDQKWNAEGKIGNFAGGWKCQRFYTTAELKAAELLRLIPREYRGDAASEPSVYDLKNLCPHCGAGRLQVTDLLITATLPKRRNVVQIPTMEWLVRTQVAESWMNHRFTGGSFRDVRCSHTAADSEIRPELYPTGRKIQELARQSKRPMLFPEAEFPELWPQLVREHEDRIWKLGDVRTRAMPEWKQLQVTSRALPTVHPTKFGISCFHEDEGARYRCPVGHTSGAHLLSEVWVERSKWDGSDLVATSNLFGISAGYAVPEPALLVSPRLYRFLSDAKIPDLSFEVVHAV